MSASQYNISALEPIGVLIHGYDLKAEKWEDVVFGDKSGKLGRVATAIEEAVNKKAMFIFWGAGGSENDEGLKESQYTYQLALGAKLQQLASRINKECSELSRYLQHVSFVETSAKNTAEEVSHAVQECQKRGVKELILVSSPTHIARCLQEACKLKEQNAGIKIKFYARPSETCFANSRAADVTIIEPNHRLNTSSTPFHESLKEIFPFFKNPAVAADLQQALANLIKEYKKKLIVKEKD